MLDCDAPFSDVTSLRFKPKLWTAENLARYVAVQKSGLKTNFCKHSIDYADII
jgi:hypothetical protein